MKRAVPLVFLLIAAVTLPVVDWVIQLVEALRGEGSEAYLIYAAVYVLATVAMVPGSALTLGAGFLWGPWIGWLVVLPAATLGATLAFQLGRTILRDQVEAQLAERPRFAAVDRAVERKGFSTVLLMRLSPLFPFNLTNYALGLTSLRLRDYTLASLLGMAPGVLMFTFIGSSLSEVGQLGTGASGHNHPALFWTGLLSTVAVTVLLTRTARQALAVELGD